MGGSREDGLKKLEQRLDRADDGGYGSGSSVAKWICYGMPVRMECMICAGMIWGCDASLYQWNDIMRKPGRRRQLVAAQPADSDPGNGDSSCDDDRRDDSEEQRAAAMTTEAKNLATGSF